MAKVINFVLASNNASSITRLTAEYANALADKGVQICISYPVFSYWDYFIWRVEREANFLPFLLNSVYRFLKFWRYMAIPAVKMAIKSKGLYWQGSVIHKMNQRVKMNRFWVLPSARNMPAADVMIVMQNYLIPRLLFLPANKGRIIGSIHMDYQEMLKDRDETSRDWWKQFLFIDQQLHVPRFAVSEAAKKSAEALGISVDCVINNGINPSEFNNTGRSNQDTIPLRVMLFCALLFEKGQDFGCEVVRELKRIYDGKQVKFVSIGQVKDEYKNIFDENLGYLHGNDYISAYQRANIFIYPSLRDGFPAPPLEALACGCALATTAVQGVVEYGVSGKNCLMAEPNDVGGMVENVQQLIEEPFLRESLRREGLETVKKFTWEGCAKRLIDFINIVERDKRNTA
ncbi:MAG: glycosyltransferase family 4 protein [bacterium]|nr:glycosyltransferase family 4 protein [bacterium]